MKKEQRDFLKQFRYFKVFEDCGLEINNDWIELKNGDIIKIYNNQLEELVFKMNGGILWDIGYSRTSNNRTSQAKDFTLKEYPEDKPLDIIEYLKMQPNFQIKQETETGISMASDEAAYITPEIINRILNDSENSVELWGGGHEKVSSYNKRQILNFDSKINYHGKGLKMISRGKQLDIKEDTNEDTEEIQVQENKLQEMIENLKPGVYSTEGSYLSLPFFLKEGEIIDFSRPEYAFSALNQSFMKVMARSTEITSPKKKLRIYQREQRDFLPGTKIRYYRLRDNIVVNEAAQFQEELRFIRGNEDLKEIGHDFNPHRINGKVSIVESDNGRISLIKVDYTNPAVYDVVDKELKKISKRLTKKEATLIHLQEVSQKQREYEKQSAEQAAKKGKNYFRIKMIADLAATYAREQPLTDEFKHEAYEYYRKNEKSYWDTWKMLSSNYDLSWEDFYMMHLIRTQKKDNRIIDATYQQKMQEERHDLVNVLNKISKKNDNQR